MNCTKKLVSLKLHLCEMIHFKKYIWPQIVFLFVADKSFLLNILSEDRNFLFILRALVSRPMFYIKNTFVYKFEISVNLNLGTLVSLWINVPLPPCLQHITSPFLLLYNNPLDQSSKISRTFWDILILNVYKQSFTRLRNLAKT